MFGDTITAQDSMSKSPENTDDDESNKQRTNRRTRLDASCPSISHSRGWFRPLALVTGFLVHWIAFLARLLIAIVHNRQQQQQQELLLRQGETTNHSWLDTLSTSRAGVVLFESLSFLDLFVYLTLIWSFPWIQFHSLANLNLRRQSVLYRVINIMLGLAVGAILSTLLLVESPAYFQLEIEGQDQEESSTSFILFVCANLMFCYQLMKNNDWQEDDGHHDRGEQQRECDSTEESASYSSGAEDADGAFAEKWNSESNNNSLRQALLMPA